jgi:hypothetical protein
LDQCLSQTHALRRNLAVAGDAVKGVGARAVHHESGKRSAGAQLLRLGRGFGAKLLLRIVGRHNPARLRLLARRSRGPLLLRHLHRVDGGHAEDRSELVRFVRALVSMVREAAAAFDLLVEAVLQELQREA